MSRSEPPATDGVTRPPRFLRPLLAAWLTADFLGEARRRGERGSGTLTTAVFKQGFWSYVFAALAFEDVTPVAFLAGTLAFASGLGALAMFGQVQDQLGHPADRDLVLACPIRPSQLYLARTVHAGLFLTAYTLGLALGPAILAAFKTRHVLALPLFVLGALVLAACQCALLQLPIVLVQRWRGRDAAASVATFLRASVFALGFLGLVLGYRAMHQGAHEFPGGAGLLHALPPYWFANATLATLGAAVEPRWLWLAAATPIVALAALGLAAQLPARLTGVRRRRWHPPRPWLGWLAVAPAERGLLTFVLTMLWRERSFRLRALPLLGLPLAAVWLGLRAGLDSDAAASFFALAHSLPIAYAPILLAFVPHAEDWAAFWIVAQSTEDPLTATRRATARAFALLILPVQALILVVELGHRGALAALATTAFAVGLSWLMLPGLARGLRRAAFSAPPDELAGPADIGPAIGLGLAALVLSMVAERLSTERVMMIGLAMVAAGALVLRGRRKHAAGA